MTAHTANSLPSALTGEVLARLAHWSTSRPDQIALQHKRRGQWKAWRWADVAREVDVLAASLRDQGVGPGTRLALSGAFEPTLLLLALAALEAGGEVVSLPRGGDTAQLRAALAALQPSHLYFQRREDIAAALQAVGDDPREVVLISAHAPVRDTDRSRVLPVADLHDGPRGDKQFLRHRHALRASSAWVEEGTEWREGLALVLTHWLGGGGSVAFPERSESAARDRRDVAPVVLLLSPARLHWLGDEIESRLAPQGSLRRRLSDWAARAPRHSLVRHLHARIRRQFGLGRLESVVSADALTPNSDHRWVGEFTRTAA